MTISVRIDYCAETYLELSLILIYLHLSIENQVTLRHNFQSNELLQSQHYSNSFDLVFE